MRWKPKDSVAIVTGASSGIGHCLTQILADHGTHVLAVARRAERLTGWSPSPGCDSFAKVIPMTGDVTDDATRRAIMEAASQINGGKVDLLVNNAGVGGIGAFADASPERLRRIMEVNFFAPVELTRQMLPLLARGRSPVICNISSVLAHRAVPQKSEYCASKFALHGWSDSIRAELAADGIQVTLVSPSTTRSDFFDSLIETDSGQSSQSMGSWSPERVARKAFAAICRRRDEVILSLGGKTLVYADRISPPLINTILAKTISSDRPE